MNKYPTDAVLASWQTTIRDRGSKSIRMSILFRFFGMSRRGSRSVNDIKEWLEERGVHTYGLDGPGSASFDDNVTLAAYPIVCIGKSVSYEKELTKRFEKEIMPQLDLRLEKGCYRPRGTRDEFDFLCKDDKGNPVVVELKRKEGEKRGVEQVMRYLGHLRTEGREGARGVLVTGYADPQTRMALQGRERDTHIDWYVYGLDGDGIRVKKIEMPSPQRRP